MIGSICDWHAEISSHLIYFDLNSERTSRLTYQWTLFLTETDAKPHNFSEYEILETINGY